MTKDKKDLLIKDLCSRLPYGVKCKTLTQDINGNDIVYEDKEDLTIYRVRRLGNEYMTIIPYLFPMSSMTKEQEKDIFRNGTFFFDRHNTLCRFPKHDDDYNYVTFEDYLEITEKLNKHHIDYRGLISIGLAIDCSNLNIY